ncbi:MAG: hypothetical protein HC781_12290 [Leptolyngbyaceae cyanobacterium CSU_1_4]|nr:hypothetical protein [Leptolyngbyaceae cyanobacterium CSU_1_4]
MDTSPNPVHVSPVHINPVHSKARLVGNSPDAGRSPRDRHCFPLRPAAVPNCRCNSGRTLHPRSRRSRSH